MTTQAFAIRTAGRGDTDWIAARHSELYEREAGFDDTFETLVRAILADFFDGHDPEHERGWIAEASSRAGCIFCVRLDPHTAKLRLFLVEPELRGHGLGQRLLVTCIDFARDRGYRRIVLWTHESHRAACRLYARNGFSCLDPRPVTSFGQHLVEQTWTLAL